MGELREPQFISRKEPKKPKSLENIEAYFKRSKEEHGMIEEDEKFIEAYYKRAEEEREMIERNKEKAEKKGRGGLYKKISGCLAGLTLLGVVHATSAYGENVAGRVLKFFISEGALDPGNILNKAGKILTAPSHAEVKGSETGPESRESRGTVMVQMGRVEGGDTLAVQRGIERALMKAGYTVISSRKSIRHVEMALEADAIINKETRDTVRARDLAEQIFKRKIGFFARWREVRVELNTSLEGTYSGEIKQSIKAEGTARSILDINFDINDVETTRRVDEDLETEAAEKATELLVGEMEKMNKARPLKPRPSRDIAPPQAPVAPPQRQSIPQSTPRSSSPQRPSTPKRYEIPHPSIEIDRRNREHLYKAGQREGDIQFENLRKTQRTDNPVLPKEIQDYYFKTFGEDYTNGVIDVWTQRRGTLEK